MAISRRVFLYWAASAFPAAAIVRRAHLAAIQELAAGAPNATLTAIGEVVLPSELGRTGVSRVVTSFVSWMKGYREHAEITHGYGTSRVHYSGPTPATRWTAQLDALDAAARKQFGARLASLSVPQRQPVIRAALVGTRLDRMPSVSDAQHVVVALLAHFYASPAATDLCYEAAIAREQCRPLAQSSRHPLPVQALHSSG